jgi:hypothetical protein
MKGKVENATILNQGKARASPTPYEGCILPLSCIHTFWSILDDIDGPRKAIISIWLFWKASFVYTNSL